MKIEMTWNTKSVPYWEKSYLAFEKVFGIKVLTEMTGNIKRVHYGEKVLFCSWIVFWLELRVPNKIQLFMWRFTLKHDIIHHTI